MSRQNCTGCCGGCGRHFTSNSAFDAHRRQRVVDGRKRFVCLDPSEIGLEAATYNGRCRIPPNNLSDVVVWRLPSSPEWAARFVDPDGEAA